MLLTACTLVSACGGVDRGGSRDDIIEQMRNQGLDPDVECIGNVLDGYTDDALGDIDDELDRPDSTDPRTQQFLDALRACTSPTTTAQP